MLLITTCALVIISPDRDITEPAPIMRPRFSPFEIISTTDPDLFWFVVLDNASAHTTPALDQFLLDNRHRLELVFLPTYSPNLNLIEKLWKMMRAQVTNNQPFADLLALSEAVVDWFEKLSFAQFCSLMGVTDTSSSCL